MDLQRLCLLNNVLACNDNFDAAKAPELLRKIELCKQLGSRIQAQRNYQQGLGEDKAANVP